MHITLSLIVFLWQQRGVQVTLLPSVCGPEHCCVSSRFAGAGVTGCAVSIAGSLLTVLYNEDSLHK